jgi:leader peptidase (prepilin peptidase)/N-methyltransferase
VLFIYFVVLVLGLLWGSFCNVCIYRLPNKGNVINSRSKCRSCNRVIRWFDNIPLISYIILQAKCRNCKTNIAFRYFLVELLTALCFLGIFYLYGVSITTLMLIILSIFFVIIFFIDLDHFIIPNELTFPLMIIGFLKSFDPNINLNLFPNYMESLIGGVLGYILIWSIITLYMKIRKKEGMGLGDAKLLSAIGFWFGWYSIPYVIFLSSLSALLIALPSLINKSKSMSSQIPFGPYLIFGTVVYLIFRNYFIFI